MRSMNEASIIYALHNRRKMNESMNEATAGFPSKAYQPAGKVDKPEYRASDKPGNPAGTGAKGVWWIMDNFISECPNCGAWLMSEEDMTQQKVRCPHCHEAVLIDVSEEIESVEGIESDLSGNGDPNDGTVYHLAADVDGIIDDPELVDADDIDDEDDLSGTDDGDYDDGYDEDEDDEDDEDEYDEDEDDEDEDDEELNELKIRIRGGKKIRVSASQAAKKARALKKKHGRKGFIATKDGKLIRMSSAQKRAARQFGKRMKRGTAISHRKRSMRKRKNLVDGYNFDENKLTSQINDALDTVFKKYTNAIPFRIVEVNDAVFSRNTDTLTLDTDIEYADGVMENASFELQGIESGNYVLTESTGDILDLPVEISGTCEIIGESIFFD